jgi:P-type E1-E2 ATPase
VLYSAQQLTRPDRFDKIEVATGCKSRRKAVFAFLGSVLEGLSNIDNSMLTGESIPVGKSPGDTVIRATMNGSGSLVIRADKVGSETLLSQIVELVAQAQRSRAPMQRMADKVAFWFVLAVLAVALATLLVRACGARSRPGRSSCSMPYRLPLRAWPGHAA